MLHSRQSVRLTAERFESFAFEIEKMLLGRRGGASRIAPAYDVRQLARDVRFVIRDVTGAPHQIYAELQLCGQRFAKHRQFDRRWRSIACLGQLQDNGFCIVNQAVRCSC